MPNGNPFQPQAVDAVQVAQATELGQQTALLQAILAALRSDNVSVGVSDALGREMILEQFPVAGAKRVLAYRTGNGFASFPVPTAGALVLPASEGRLGCQFVNTGANPVILYLADQARAGVPTVWLAATGGSWDGRFGQMPWSGNVFAVAQTAASTLSGGEL